MKFGSFPDEPLLDLVRNPPSKHNHQNETHVNMTQILHSAGRKAIKVLPDGNCFFRSLSFCFYKTQDRHMEVRRTLVDFISENGGDYEPLVFQGTLTDHLKRMRNPSTWGTQVELQAAADYYKTCIYLLTKRGQQDRYGWLVYKPRNCSMPADGFPHIELVHPGSVHFDAVVDAATLLSPKSVPQLDGVTDNFEGVL